eukprot:77343_1
MFHSLVLLSVVAITFGDGTDSGDSGSTDSDDVSSNEEIQLLHDWGYSNMAEWAKDYPDCAAHDESPIDIESNTAISDSSVCVAQFDWKINYDHHIFKVINNGHSLQLIAVKPNHYSLWPLRRRLKTMEYTALNSNYNTIATFPDYFASTPEHTAFCLHSFHFHFGKSSDYGSEHTIDTHHFALEAHFVHYVCDSITFEEALTDYPNEEDQHVLAVVAVLFDVSETNNPAFDAILADDVLPHIEFPDDVDTKSTEGMAVIDNLDLADIIPQTLDTDGYFAYEGSLTTPPCTNVVRWHVMNARGSISETQLEKMRKLYDAKGESIAPNYRDVQQNVNGVWACISKEDAQQNISELFGDEHTSLKISSFIIIGLGITIFVLLLCMVWFHARNQSMRPKDTDRLFQDEMDDNISDTETLLESDVLIHDALYS